MSTATQEPPVSEQPAPKKVVRIKRLQIGINVLVQLVVLFVIVAMVNFISFKHFKRWDFSRNQKYALSEQTRQILGGLKKPVHAVIFFSSGQEIYGDLTGLLREYEFASNKQFQTEAVDPYRNFSRARELQAKYKFGSNENVLILDYEGKNKFVNAADMAEMDVSMAMYGQPPTVKAFKGEQAITSALLELTEEKQNKVYVLAGHGEPDLSQAPAAPGARATGTESIKALKTYIDRQNIKSEPLKLADVDRVPGDARTLLLIAPKYDFSEREMLMIRAYWERKGRLFISLDPTRPLPRLTAFLDENGLRPADDRVLRTVAMGPVTGILRDVTGAFTGASPITKRLEGVSTQFVGQTQSLSADPAKTAPLGIKVTPLIEAAKEFWGETDYRGGEGSPVFFDPRKDHAGPLTVAVSVEKGALADSRVNVETSRMVVIGNGDFLKDQGLTEVGLDFTLSGLNWLLNREEIIGVAPKEKKMFTLNLSEDQIATIMYTVMGAIPGAAALLGILSWWTRRR